MRLNALRLSNFRQHLDSRILFESGITGIIGPNGSGKSTILEAIAWALYGQQAARGTRDSIRFSRAGPRASVRVELEFELAGHAYRVVRGLTNAELYLDGGEDPIANTISSVGEALQRRLGMTRAEFFHTYFTAQKELNAMVSMGPSERAQFLNRVLGYERLRVAQELVRDRRRELAAELSGVRSAMPDPDAVARALSESQMRLESATRANGEAKRRYDDAVQSLAGINPTWSDAQAARERHLELTAELRVIETQIETAGRDRERVQADLAGLASANAELRETTAKIAPLAELVGEFTHLEELAREEGRRATLADSLKALAEELTALRARADRLSRAPSHEEEVTLALERARRDHQEASGKLEALRTDWVRDRQEAETKRDALRQQYAELKDQREHVLSLGEDGTCPTCTRVLGSSFRTVLDQLDSQMETITVDGRYFATRLEQLEQVPAEIVRLDEQSRELDREVQGGVAALARVKGEVQELAQVTRDINAKQRRYDQQVADLNAIPTGYDAQRHEALREKTEALGPLNEKLTRLTTLLEREPGLRQESERIVAHLSTLGAKREELERARHDVRFSESDYSALRAEQEQAAAEVHAAEVARASAQSELGAAQRALDVAQRAKADLEKAVERAEALNRDKRLHDELDRSYTDLRTDLNHALRPELSELASAFLAELTDHRYSELELDDQYNVVVLEEGRPKPVISGGEEDLANLTLRLAISQMIAERAGQAFSLLVLDEVFGSLDESRRHNVVDLLRRLQDRFEQVILITHIESVREGLDRVIGVAYDLESGASVVKVSGDALPAWDEMAALAGVAGDDA